MTDGVSVLVFVEMVLSFVSTLSVEEESLLFDTSFIEFPKSALTSFIVLESTEINMPVILPVKGVYPEISSDCSEMLVEFKSLVADIADIVTNRHKNTANSIETFLKFIVNLPLNMKKSYCSQIYNTFNI